MVHPVSDVASNPNENIAHAATVIGRSPQRRAVFQAIYTGKQKIKTVPELASTTGLSEKRVVELGRQLASNSTVIQTKIQGRVAYEKIPFFQQNKQKILSLCKSPKKLAAYPTKRNPTPTKTSVTVKFTPERAKAVRVVLEDIASFAAAHSAGPSGNLPESVSEAEFKAGVQSILGESGTFQDWGGEKNDLFTTRLSVKGSVLPAAIAFKGPGTRGRLTPKLMGKHGDQIQRLFESDARVFLVQYWAQIDERVAEQMYAFAVAKSVLSGQTIYYGTIDGIDSNRLYTAYAEHYS